MKEETKERLRKLKKLKEEGKDTREIFDEMNKDEQVFRSLSEVRRFSYMVEQDLGLDKKGEIGSTVSHDELFVTDELIEKIAKG